MAGLTLAKGNNLSLTKTSPGLTVATVGLFAAAIWLGYGGGV